MPLLDTVLAEGTEAEADEIFVVPASFAQQRLWFLEHLSPGLASYNVPLALRIRGPLAADRLEQALNSVVDRHEVLRSALGQEEDDAVQLISPTLEIPLRRIEAGEAAALRQAAEEARQPFDLSRFPLLRASLWRLAADDHLLLVVFHHAITDDWSHGIFLRELFAFYGGQTSLPDLPIQYGDFAAWQREWLTGETLELKLMPWRRRLEGAPDTLALPTDRPRVKDADTGAGMLRVSVPAPLFAALQETARAHGATTFMVLLAGLQCLLARHSGKSDLLVGCPVANRNRLETEDLIGFFTNTLVLRGDLRDAPSFGTFLARVREVAVEAFANEDLPFEKLVEDLNPARRLDQNPLFQVMFSFHRAELPSEPLPGLSLEPVEIFAGAAKVDLNLNLAESPDGVSGIWEYAAALFDRATALRLSERWLTLLADAAAHPDRPISDLALLPASERHQIVSEWSWVPRRATRDLDRAPGAPLAHQIFEHQADQTPDAPAAVFEEKSLTYCELEARANQLANHLRRLGVRTDALVGLCLERSLDLPAAVLGVLKAGAAYVPLDPEYPAERLAFMAADAGLSALVTHQAFAGRVPVPPDLPVVSLDTDRALLEAESAGRPESGAAPASLVYLIYTSGSTGRPKGISLPHRALVNLIDWRLAGSDLPPGSVTLQFSSLSFDASFHEMFSAWGSAGSVALISEEVRRDPVELLRRIDHHGVHRLYLPFIAFQMLARAAEAPRHVPAALREVLSTGEQLQVTPQVRSFFARLPECRLENHYGPSETHVITGLRLGPDPAEWPAVPGIGRAIDGTWIYLVDRDLRPIPIGVPGELLAGGVGLARGYAGRPDLTAERFVPNPFADPIDLADDHGPGSRLYRTGDLARTLHDGSIELLGRIDTQLKIRGVRLEPAEIEAALSEHPAVAECAVVARPLGTGDLALVAYAAPQPGTAPAPRQLREFLAGKLPDAAVPSFFVTVPALPRTPSGKVDRKALPAPGAELIGAGFVPPRTPTEEVLAGLWREILRIDRAVGAHESFFDLGGHSLTAMSFTNQVRPLFHVDLPTRTIFEAPVLAHLAERIDRLVHAKEGLELPPLRRMERGAEAPLSFAQQRLWFVDTLAGGRSPFYNVGAPRELRGPLDPRALARAFGEIVRRHEALRTTFRLEAGGAAVQTVHPPGSLEHPLPWIDLSGLPADRAVRAAKALLEENAFQHFDLTTGPLLRTVLVRLGEEHHFLGITLHHIVFDGWSLGVLDRELAALYGAFLAGEPAHLPELPVQYPDYALWQRSWLEAGPTLEKQLDFWRNQLDGAPRLLELPTDRPRPAVQRYEGGSVVRDLPEGLARGLDELARHHQVTPFMVLLAAFATLLSRHGGQDDLLVGSPLANRDRAEIEGLIGFFVNLLVLRVDLTGDPTFEQLLARVRETALHAYAHQDLPFEALVDELQPERNLSTNPLFQAVLSLQDGSQGVGPATGLELPGLVSQPFGFDHQEALFDLTLVVRRTLTADDVGLSAILNFKRSLFDHTTMARMLGELERLLEGAVAAPATPVSALPLWSEAARHQVLREWNDTRIALPGTVPADRLVASVAERTPDALALTGPDGRLTYAELDERANRLARHLRSRGVRLESPVALCLERSVELVVAALAVLKAGGSYLPVDPAAPEQRLAWMVEDSGAAVVVTQELWAARLGGAPVVLLDGDAGAIASEPATAPESGHAPETLAYVIYTSGSTGRPKGVAVEHRALLDNLAWHHRRYAITAADRLSATTSPLFDPSVTETWSALTAGATLCVPPSAIVPVAGELLDWLAAERVTRCFLPTVLARAFLEHSRPAGLALATFATGGDRCPNLPPGLPYGFEDWYGPTEFTVVATVAAVTHDSPPNVGRPVDNAEVYLLDRHQRPAPLGGAGEICLGGAGLSRGYLRRPDLTAERYVPHPFSGEPGARLYRTGDRGRFRSDGTLEFLGRTDHQVKMRGFRIELGEVELVLGHHPGVRESAVVMRELAPGDFGLAAYYAPREAPGPSPDALRAWLGESLPDYMMPAAIIRLEALPRTLNGKLDRAALPVPDRGTEASAYVPPRTATEEALAALWQELLGIERVGAEDHFFLLGGHSLLAVSLAARLRDRFRVSLSMQVVFEEPVLAALAAAVDRAVESGEPAEESPALVAGARKVRTPRGARA